jgi:hypothetical protein
MVRIAGIGPWFVSAVATPLSRSRRLAVWATGLGIALLSGCSGEALPLPGPGASGGVPAPSPDAAGWAAIAPKTGRGSDAAPAPATPRSCTELAAEGSPGALVALGWQIQRRLCPSSACEDFVSLSGCTARLQRNDIPRTITLEPPHCTAVRSLVTGASFLRALETGEGCVLREIAEAFDVSLTDSRAYRRKTFGCEEPAISGVRACLAQVLETYFP